MSLYFNDDLKQALIKLTQEGFDERSDQISMMHTVAEAFAQKKIAVIEGGTGVGKTFGYLLPLILKLQSQKKCSEKSLILIIATATVALQSQLAEEDFPRLLKLLKSPLKVEIAKGRGRYLCPNKLFQYLHGESASLALFSIEEAAPSLQENTLVEEIATFFESEKWTGDYDALPFPVSQKIWKRLITDSSGCTNRHCRFFSRCPYFKNKKKLAEADIIVTNHDLLLSDIGLGTGSLLPKREQCFYVIDEAHHLPQKGIDHFAAHCSFSATQKNLETLLKVLERLCPLVLGGNTVQLHIERSAENMSHALEALHPLIQAHFQAEPNQEIWILPNWPEDYHTFGKICIEEGRNIQDLLLHLQEQLTQEYTTQTLPDYDTYLASLGFFIERIYQLSRAFQLLLTTPPKETPPVAKWIIQKSYEKIKTDFTLHVAMTDAGRLLYEQFWKSLKNGALLCSATLRALGSFQDFLEKSGLTLMPDIKTLAFPSPFPYQDSKLVIPDMKYTPEGKNRDHHTQELVGHLEAILKQETRGVLVLFTSSATMQMVYESISNILYPKILMQTHYTKTELIKLHRSRVDQDKLSIIFGLQSYAEGIDLKGDYCEHLVITKLPFSVPTTPIEQTRQNWLQSLGRDPFLEHALPEASIRLTQFVGRLIRHPQDRGTVTILDSRLKTRFYGQKLLDNLPPFTICK